MELVFETGSGHGQWLVLSGCGQGGALEGPRSPRRLRANDGGTTQVERAVIEATEVDRPVPMPSRRGGG